MAHLAYFRREFVERREWLSDKAYASVVGLSQFLPGPGSSQVGMALGYHRGGFAGLGLAWLLFTAPSAILLACFGLFMGTGSFNAADAGWVKGLLAAAVAVVLHAVVGMAKNFLHSVLHWVIAVATLMLVLFVDHPLVQIGAILAAGVVGLLVHSLAKENPTDGTDGTDGTDSTDATESADNDAARDDIRSVRPVPKNVAYACLVAFFVLLVGLWVGANTVGGYVLTRAHAFYHAGALVFGGGHVVLPLLEEQTVASGWMSQEQFLSGYSVTQAVPGPIFTFAAYLGAVDGGVWGAVLATIAIFLPAGLLMVSGLYFWTKWQDNQRLKTAFAAINAAVVGLLAAALIDPVAVHGITSVPAGIIAAACYLGTRFLSLPPWLIAAGGALAGFIFL